MKFFILVAALLISLSPQAATPLILNVGNASEPKDLDPQTATSNNEFHVLTNLFEGLVSKDPKDLKIIPGVAEKWEQSKNGLQYTFHLRKTAKWSNGDPITAQDFIYGWTRLLTPATTAEYSSFGYYFKNGKYYYEGKIKDSAQLGFKALDAHTIQITLEHTSPFFLTLLAHPSLFPVHKTTIEKFGPKWTRPENIVTNGAFVLNKWVMNQSLHLKKSPNYWNKSQVKPDEVFVHAITKADTEEKMFRAGDLDVTAQVPIEKIPYWEKDSTGVLQKHPYLGVYFLWFNTKMPPLDNLLVRTALNLAIDREAITHKVTLAKQMPGMFFVPPGTGGYEPKPVLPKDGSQIKKAQELLAKAGYPGGKGFPRIELLYNTDENNKKIMEAIQQMWKTNLGIDVPLLNQEWKVVLEAQHLMNFAISRQGWIADYNQPLAFLEILSKDNGNNHSNWSNPKFDELIMKASREPNQKRRIKSYAQAEAILLEELPILPIYIYTRLYLKSPKIQGWDPNVEDYRMFQYVSKK